MSKQSVSHAYRAGIFHCLADPTSTATPEEAYEYYADGILVINDEGKVERLGPADQILPTLPSGFPITTYPNAIITPGFIDTHNHFPQTEMIAAFGEQLLDWLETYTFPTESKFQSLEYARQVAGVYLDELLRNGTTTAMAFSSVHAESAEALFKEAYQRDMCLITGKVLMDRHAPETVRDTPEAGCTQSRTLIEQWHGKGRLHYAVTPRFAITSTPEQLEAAGHLLKEYDGLYMQTHLSENHKEIAWISELFPERCHYLDVYDHYGLVGPRSVFAHGIHLCEDEIQRLARQDAAISFCPTSNLFLGSGLFNLKQMKQHKVKVSLGSDVGAGTSFSMLQTLNEAYKVTQMRGDKLSPFESFYLATLAGAETLQLDDRLGNFLPGKEADFIVLDLHSTPLMQYRMNNCNNVFETLFVLCILGDDRNIKETFVKGISRHQRDQATH